MASAETAAQPGQRGAHPASLDTSTVASDGRFDLDERGLEGCTQVHVRS